MTPDQLLIDAVGAAKNTRGLIGALREYYRGAEANGEEVKGQFPVPLACREGCAFCCYIPVSGRAQEIFLLADFIRSNFSPDAQAALTERLRKHSAMVSPLSKEAQMVINIPCPLLDGSRCSVYTVRPLACRSYHSLDVSSCQRSYEHPDDLNETRPQLAPLVSTWTAMTNLARGAFADHGYDETGYELGSALLEALTNPASWRRFYRRKKAFPTAKHL
jgi:Fe-S-cluster containining protein